jgi:hypothetical protein
MAANGQPPAVPQPLQLPASADGAAASSSTNSRDGSQLELHADIAGRMVTVLITPPAPTRTAAAGTNTGGRRHSVLQGGAWDSPSANAQRPPPLPPPPLLPPQQQQQHPGKHDAVGHQQTLVVCTLPLGRTTLLAAPSKTRRAIFDCHYLVQHVVGRIGSRLLGSKRNSRRLCSACMAARQRLPARCCIGSSCSCSPPPLTLICRSCSVAHSFPLEPHLVSRRWSPTHCFAFRWVLQWLVSELPRSPKNELLAAIEMLLHTLEYCWTAALKTSDYMQTEYPRMPPPLCFVALEAAAFAAGGCTPEAAVASAVGDVAKVARSGTS